MTELKNWDKYSSVSEADQNQPRNLNDSQLSVYNEKEIEYLDRYLPMAKNAFDEPELYEIILDCNFQDEKIEFLIRERLKLMQVKGEEYGWKVVGKQKKSEQTEDVNKGKKGNSGKEKSNFRKNQYHEYNTGNDQNYYDEVENHYSEQYGNNYYQRRNWAGKNYNNRYRTNQEQDYHQNNTEHTDQNQQNEYTDENTNNNFSNYGNNQFDKYRYRYTNRQYGRGRNYYNNQSYYQNNFTEGYYNNKYSNNYNTNSYNNEYYNNNNNRYQNRYKAKRRANYNQERGADYVDVTDVKYEKNQQNEETVISHVGNQETLHRLVENLEKNQTPVLEATPISNTQNLRDMHPEPIKNSPFVNPSQNNTTGPVRELNNTPVNTVNITNTIFSQENNFSRSSEKTHFDQDKEEKPKIVEESHMDLKHYFEVLRNSATNNSELSRTAMMNKLKQDVLTNQYYNNNLTTQKKYENVSNNSSNIGFNRAKPQISQPQLHLNSEFFEISNPKDSSRVEYLNHSKIDKNINNLSFSLNSSNNKETAPIRKNNDFVIQSESVIMGSNKPAQTKTEHQPNKEYQPDNFFNNQILDFGNSNKFNSKQGTAPTTTTIPPNFYNMYGANPYFYNQEAMNKFQNFDEQQMMANSYFAQGGFPMQMSYYGFPYPIPDQRMFNMQMGQMDPAYLNMIYAYNMQNMQQHPQQHVFPSSNVNYKK